LQLHAVAQPRERPAPGSIERLSLSDHRLEAVGEETADGPSFLGSNDTGFPQEIGIEFQRDVCLHG
jgi:hypothetical protein